MNLSDDSSFNLKCVYHLVFKGIIEEFMFAYFLHHTSHVCESKMCKEMTWVRG